MKRFIAWLAEHEGPGFLYFEGESPKDIIKRLDLDPALASLEAEIIPGVVQFGDHTVFEVDAGTLKKLRDDVEDYVLEDEPGCKELVLRDPSDGTRYFIPLRGKFGGKILELLKHVGKELILISG